MSSTTAKQNFIKPVIRTLYRQLYRLGVDYGKHAELSKRTVKQEIDRCTALAESANRKTSVKSASNRVDEDDESMTGLIPLAPGLMIAIRGRSSEDSSHGSSLNRFDSTKSISEAGALSEILAATSVDTAETLTTKLYHQMIAEHFRHPKTSRDLNEQQLIGVGFLALRTLKERVQSIRNALTQRTQSSSTLSSQTGDLTLDSFVADAPDLVNLTNEATTEAEGIRIHIKTKNSPIPEIHSLSGPPNRPSSPSVQHSFHFSYEITITNIHPSRTVQLLRRAWDFSDVKGVVQRVSGSGVVGQTPVLIPQQSFKYESHVNLAETRGSMKGALTFQLIEDPLKSSSMKSGDKFDVPVGPVLLAVAVKSTPSQATET